MPEAEKNVRKVSDTYIEVPAIFAEHQLEAPPLVVRPGANETAVCVNPGNSLAEVDAEQLIEAVRALTAPVEGRALVEVPIEELQVLLDHIDPNCSSGAEEKSVLERGRARLARALSIEQGSCGAAETPESAAA